MTPEALAEAVAQADRRALSRAITLVESARPDHREDALRLLAALPRDRQALRIGITGTPGVGKSTFIEAFGLMLAEKNLRLGVLAVDPSSARSGGSILGDKTRMERLSRHPGAFIRPSPSQAALGGLARRSRDVVALFEGYGCDVVLIETVGVGQSETVVADLCDIFLLLIAPAGGDELQGVKRGIMELADLIVVNKADGDLKPTAKRTAADYAGALRLLRRRAEDAPGFPRTLLVSAQTGDGLPETWEAIEELAQWRRDAGIWDTRRKQQARRWFDDELRQGVDALLSKPPLADRVAAAAAEVSAGRLTPEAAAARVLSHIALGPDPVSAPGTDPEFPRIPAREGG